MQRFSMIDHSRFKTEYDIEAQLGSDYFLAILEAAYKAKELPREVEAGNIKIKLQKPDRATILDHNEEADLEINIPTDFDLLPDLTIGVDVRFTIENVTLSFKYLSQRDAISDLGSSAGNPDLGQKVENKIKNNLNRNLPLMMGNNDIVELKAKQLEGTGNFQNVFALGMNLDLKTAPQNQRSEEEYNQRGNINRAVSFLPEGKASAVGIPIDTFRYMANDTWHGFATSSNSHPFMVKGKKKGHYKSVSIGPAYGSIIISIKSEYCIDNWPDTDVTAIFTITPIIVSEKLNFDIKLQDFDADSGVGGVTAMELTEILKENALGNRALSEAKRRGVASVLSAFPVRKTLFTNREDSLVDEGHDIVTLFEGVEVNPEGMSFWGKAKAGITLTPKDAKLISRKNTDDAES